MPIGLISIPGDQRDDFIMRSSSSIYVTASWSRTFRTIQDRSESASRSSADPQWAAERLGQIIDAANEVAGRTFHAVGGGAYWPETAKTL